MVTRSLGDMSKIWAVETPDKTAFYAGDELITYAELDRCSDALANELRSAGAVAGDRIGYLGRNHLGYPVVVVAASKIGAICVGLNWRLSANELAGVLADAEPHTVFHDDEFATAVHGAVAENPAPPRLYSLGADLAGVRSLPVGSMAVAPTSDPDATAWLTYTSGTTGQPKGVMSSHRGIHEHLNTEMPWTFDASSVGLIASPVFHAVGSMWTALTLNAGASSVLLADPSPGAVLEAIERHNITHGLVVPALLQVLLDHPDREQRDLTSLKTLIYGASPIAERLLERAAELLPWCDLAQGYGMTETTGPVTFLWPHDHIVGSPLLRTAGQAASNCRIRVVDLVSQQDAPVGQPGEVRVKTAQACVGYWRNDVETAALFDDEGWLRTGDVGTLDAEGYLTLTDRVKDVIVSGGENVYSGEVERVVTALEGVIEACVVGQPDTRWGETVVAVVVASSDNLSPDDVIAHCRTELAHYKCPTVVHFATSPLPRNPAGKILRRAVRSEYVTTSAP